MKTSYFLAVISLLSLAWLPLAMAEPAAGKSAADLIADGHKHALAYDEENALKCFEAAAKLDPENATIYVAIAREYRHLGSEAESAEDKQAQLDQALVYSLKAAELGPSDSEAQLAPAITYGKILLLEEDTSVQLELSRKIKTAVDKALELDDSNDTAWYVLACWHRGFAKVGGMKRFFGGIVHGDIPKTTYENAVACFSRAIDINPQRLMHRIELGRVYATMGKEEEARKEIALGLSLEETDKDDPETKQRGRATLVELD